MTTIQIILAALGGISAYLGFIFLMSRFLIIAIGDNDDLGSEVIGYE